MATVYNPVVGLPLLASGEELLALDDQLPVRHPELARLARSGLLPELHQCFLQIILHSRLDILDLWAMYTECIRHFLTLY